MSSSVTIADLCYLFKLFTRVNFIFYWIDWIIRKIVFAILHILFKFISDNLPFFSRSASSQYFIVSSFQVNSLINPGVFTLMTSRTSLIFIGLKYHRDICRKVLHSFVDVSHANASFSASCRDWQGDCFLWCTYTLLYHTIYRFALS